MMLKDAHKRTMFAVRGAVSLASRPMRRVVPRSCRVRAQSGCPGGIVCRGPRAWADNVVVRYLVQQYLSFRRTRFVSYFVRDTCDGSRRVCTCTPIPASLRPARSRSHRRRDPALLLYFDPMPLVPGRLHLGISYWQRGSETSDGAPPSLNASCLKATKPQRLHLKAAGG